MNPKSYPQTLHGRFYYLSLSLIGNSLMIQTLERINNINFLYRSDDEYATNIKFEQTAFIYHKLFV